MILSDAEIFTLLGQKLGASVAIDAEFTEKLKIKLVPFALPSTIKEENGSQNQTDSSLKLSVSRKLFDYGVRVKHSPAIAKLVKEPRIEMHPDEGVGFAEGDTIKVSSEFGSLKGKVNLHKGIAKGTVVIPEGFMDLPLQELGLNLVNGLAVKVEKV